MKNKLPTASDQEALLKRRLIEARSFRQIAILVLRGEADRDAKGFVEKVKWIMKEAADAGA